MAELAYATDLKSVAQSGLRVRVPLVLPEYGPIVQRLGRRPFTAKTGVRFPLGLLEGDMRP